MLDATRSRLPVTAPRTPGGRAAVQLGDRFEAASARASSPVDGWLEPATLTMLQRSAGNRAVLTLLGSTAGGASRQAGRAALTVQRVDDPDITDLAISTGDDPIHVPTCGPTIRATLEPDGLTGVTWSLVDGSATVAGGTRMVPNRGNNSRADLRVAADQSGGTVEVKAENAAGEITRDVDFRRHPTGIDATTRVGEPTDPDAYGGLFDHTLRSPDGDTASLEGVPVGERFSRVPNPTGTEHRNVNSPFGKFTLSTSQLTADLSNNWFVSADGELGGSHDEIAFSKAGVNVGRFIRSASNRRPSGALPRAFDLTQGLRAHCAQRPGMPGWRPPFVNVIHRRGLRMDGTGVVFFTAVGPAGALTEHVEPYAGPTAFRNARADPNPVETSVGLPPGAPPETAEHTPNTSQIAVDTVPDPGAGSLVFSIEGPDRGCSIDETTGLLTVGSEAGRVLVRVTDDDPGNPNFDEVTVRITAARRAR